MPNAGQDIDTTRESSTGAHVTQQVQRDGEAPGSEPSTANEDSLTYRLFHAFSRHEIVNRLNQTPSLQDEQAQDPYSTGTLGDNSLTAQMHNGAERKKNGAIVPRAGLVPRPIGGQEKLGMFSGVYVPTCLNVLSILMFLRFGFILGQSGVLGIMG